MKSVILQLGVRTLKYIFLVVSVWLLLRGHNQPGGGFIGGLIAGSALIFKPLAFEIESLQGKGNKQSAIFVTIGLSTVLLSAALGILVNGLMLDGLWWKLPLPINGQTLKLGTPLLFDIGVYFTVIGFLFFIISTMMEEWQWKE